MGSSVIHYHYHPKYSRNKIADFLKQVLLIPEDIPEEKKKFVNYRFTKIANTICSLPSKKDMELFFALNRRSQNCDVIYKIVSPMGIISMKINDDVQYRDVKNIYPDFGTTDIISFLCRDKNLVAVDNVFNFFDENLEGKISFEMEFSNKGKRNIEKIKQGLKIGLAPSFTNI